MSYAEIIHEAESKFGAGKSNWFKFKEGPNKIRILDAARPYHGVGFNGEPTTKYLHWVLDRADGKIKPAHLPYRIVKALGDLEKSEDYGFDGFPMPFDVTVKATNAGSKDVEYTVIP